MSYKCPTCGQWASCWSPPVKIEPAGALDNLLHTNPTNPADGDVVTHDDAHAALQDVICMKEAEESEAILARYIAQQRAKEAQQPSDQDSANALINLNPTDPRQSKDKHESNETAGK